MEIAFYTLLTIVIFTAVLSLGGWGWIGSKIAKTLPHAPLKTGDKAAIYLNGKYNRTATVTKVTVEYVYIYDNMVKLPVDFRGRFYAIGVDTTDASKVVFLTNRGHYRLIRVAELIRKVFALVDDESNLTPEYSENECLKMQPSEEGEDDEC